MEIDVDVERSGVPDVAPAVGEDLQMGAVFFFLMKQEGFDPLLEFIY